MVDKLDLSIAVVGAGKGLPLPDAIAKLKTLVMVVANILRKTGMGGLSCALALAKKGFRDITVYEHAPGLGFVGAGIQLAPNMARILDRLGCWNEIYAKSTNVKETSIRRK